MFWADKQVMENILHASIARPSRRSNQAKHVLSVEVKGKNILIGTYYRPPGQTSEVKQSFLNYFSISVERALKRKPFLLLIVGDFNDRCLTWHSSHENSELQLNLYNTIQSFNLVQVIDTPTRLSSITKSLLDLMITDSPALVE